MRRVTGKHWEFHVSMPSRRFRSKLCIYPFG
jgi:hypothetical protein